MFAVVVSLIVSQRLQHDSVYALGLARKGIRLQRGRDVEVLDTIAVSEVMQTETDTLRESDPVAIAAEFFAQTRHHGLPVVDARGELCGILTVQDVERVQLDGNNTITIGQACTRELLTVFPDETIGTALRRMSTRDIGRLPVVARDNRRQSAGHPAPHRSGAGLRHRFDAPHHHAPHCATGTSGRLQWSANHRSDD